MLNTAFISTFLKVNHLEPNTAEEDLRVAMQRARWDPDEISETISYLKNPGSAGTQTAPAGPPGQHVVIAAMGGSVANPAAQLGIAGLANIEANHLARQAAQMRSIRMNLYLHSALTVGLSVIVAALGGIALAYFYHLGPFYQLDPSSQLVPQAAMELR